MDIATNIMWMLGLAAASVLATPFLLRMLARVMRRISLITLMVAVAIVSAIASLPVTALVCLGRANNAMIAAGVPQLTAIAVTWGTLLGLYIVAITALVRHRRSRRHGARRVATGA